MGGGTHRDPGTRIGTQLGDFGLGQRSEMEWDELVGVCVLCLGSAGAFRIVEFRCWG